MFDIKTENEQKNNIPIIKDEDDSAIIWDWKKVFFSDGWKYDLSEQFE